MTLLTKIEQYFLKWKPLLFVIGVDNAYDAPYTIPNKCKKDILPGPVGTTLQVLFCAEESKDN